MMRKIWSVLKLEVYAVASRLTFWLVFLVPFVSILVYLAAANINQSAPSAGRQANESLPAIEGILKPERDTRPQGFVDAGNLVRVYPADFPKEALIAFADQASARRALDAGEISAYYAISPDYMDSGLITVHMAEYKLTSAWNYDQLEVLLNYNLLGGDDTLFNRFLYPVKDLERESLASQDIVIRENNSQAALSISLVVMALFMFGIMGSATLLLNSMTAEKENRVIEVIMVSASPTQLLVGKMAGLGLISLFQMLVWLCSMVAFLRLSGSRFRLPDELMLQPSIIGWGILFFILGYLVYASIMAGIGALVPNMREATQVAGLVMSPIIIPELLAPMTVGDPHAAAPVFFSMFPLTSPVMMMMRLSIDRVPLWQLVLSAVLLALAVVVLMRLVAGLFRAQTFLTGKHFRLSAVLTAFRRNKI